MPWSRQIASRQTVRLAVGMSVASALVLVASVAVIVVLVDTLMVH